MIKTLRMLLLGALAGAFGPAMAMNSPPPIDQGWQRMIVETMIDAWSGPALPGIDIGTPLEASWVFDSDQSGAGRIEITQFSMLLAGTSYSQQDVVTGWMVIWESTAGIAGTIELDANGVLPALALGFFEEFGDSNLWLNFAQGTRAGAQLSGRYEPVPEPGTHALMLAGLIAVVLCQRRRQSLTRR